MKLSPEERADLEAMRDRPVPKHPLEKHVYEIDGYRAKIGKKAEVKAERARIDRARIAWASLDPTTKDYLRWMTAGRVIEMLGQSSNKAVADSVAASTEDEIARLTGELAEGYSFEDTGDGFEVAEECEVVPGEGPGPLDLPSMLDEAENALRLPPNAPEKIPNLRNVVSELYAIWRKDKPDWRRDQRGVPKIGKEAIEQIGTEVATLFGLTTDDAQRRTETILRDLDAKDSLPMGNRTGGGQ